MRPLNADIQNFGSYSWLNFNFNDQGLALVSGLTGAGKSTILDIIPWIAFGQTAKGGKVDDIRSWTKPHEPTIGRLTVETKQGIILISRVRSEKGNDLYYSEESTPQTQVRGKDLNETQKLINERLQCDFDTHRTGAYLSDTSPASSFYVMPAKARRELFEKIADLSLPTKLTERTQNAKKITKKTQIEAKTSHDRALGKVDSIATYLERAASDSDTWEKTRLEKIKRLETLRDNFETEKQSKIAALETKRVVWHTNQHDKVLKLIEKLNRVTAQVQSTEVLQDELEQAKTESRCVTCGGVLGSAEAIVQKILEKITLNNNKIQERQTLLQSIDECDDLDSPFEVSIETAYELENHYEDQLAAECDKENPYETQWSRLVEDMDITSSEATKLGQDLASINRRYKALEHLQDLASDLRGVLLFSAVSQIETKTNELLQAYFEGAFRVTFTVIGDDLEVSIQKSGYDCTYLQLSKGQRRLLTLCFSIAMLEASANNSGIHFDCLAFDEPTDGCDEDLKQMAYPLFQDLATRHSTVLVIDHSKSFQNQFDKRYNVELVGDNSVLHEES